MEDPENSETNKILCEERKKVMKKLIAMMLVLTMVFVFVACGEEAAPAANGGDEITGEVYDAGNVQVLVPGGWKAFGVSDIFGEDGAMDPDAVQICKGGETELDLWSKPYIQINYYGADTDMMQPSKDFYDNAEDIDPMTIGSHTWNGFTCESLGAKIAILWAEDGDHQYQASVYLEAGDETISLTDADVQAILESVTPSAA